MSTQSITLCEFGPISAGSGEQTVDHAYLPQKQFEQLEKFVLANQREEPEFGQLMTVSFQRGYGKVIKAQNYVGVITLKDGTTIEILPKISSVSYDEEKTKGEMRKLLVRMLRSLRSVPYKSTQSSKIDAEKLPLFEIFVRMFLDEVFFIVRKGLKCGYETIRGNEKFYKGKMLFGEQIKYNSIHKERFFIEYDEFNANRAENKLLKSTLLLLARKSVSAANQADIRNLLVLFSEISPSKDYEKDFSVSCLERSTQYYRGALDWCKIFLAGKSFLSFRGEEYASALLFPMERLFQDYVAKEIRRVLMPHGWAVSTQESAQYLFDDPQKFKLRPDIVVRKDGKTYIFDTKWKLLCDDATKNYRISQGDMYQMYAYHKKYESENETICGVYLLYPQFDENFVGLKYSSAKDKVNVKIRFIDLMNIGKKSGFGETLDDVLTDSIWCRTVSIKE